MGKSRFSLPLVMALAVATMVTTAATSWAADMITVGGSPALQFDYAEFERRGVSIPTGGALVVRNDGCWTANMEVQNGSGDVRTVSVVIRMTSPRGHVIANLVLLDREVVENTETVAINAGDCNSALESAFPILANYSAARVLSVR